MSAAASEVGGDGPSAFSSVVEMCSLPGKEEYPTGEMEMEEFGAWKRFAVKLRMLVAFPWERVKKGSVLSIKLEGKIIDQLKSRFCPGLSLPQICESFTKAAYDPRISGIYLQIEPIDCGWAKIDEIRRHILHFKKSGKFILGYVPICREKEYYLACACGELYAPPSAYVSLYGLSVQATFIGGVFEKIGIKPEIQRIGKYKSYGDHLSRKSMSEENREMLSSILDNICQNWLDTISSTHGKGKQEIEAFINSGVYQVERLKEEGWITNVLYDDEIINMLKERLGITRDKKLPMVNHKRYSKVKKWTLGLTGGKDKIAIIRASGNIIRSSGSSSLHFAGIVAEKLIKKIHSIRDSKRYKAVIIRIDSSGGDGLASDLLWREIKILAASKPVIASMSDSAASGGYYMAMAAEAVVAEKLSLTGSIGVITAKFSREKLYEKIGYTKEILSRGKYAELRPANHRGFTPIEAELFAKSAQNFYKQFRDKAALSRSMTVDEMEAVAQGRVWTGADAASKGLVDAVGGLSCAIAIAKQKANIPQNKKIKLVEISKPRLSLLGILSGMVASFLGLNSAIKEVVQELTSTPEGIQARLDNIMFDSGTLSPPNAIFSLVRDI